MMIPALNVAPRRRLLLACLASAGALSLVLGACGSDSANPGGGDGADAGADAPSGSADGSLADGAKSPGPWTTRGICSKDAWCWDHPLPQGNLLKDVWAAASNDVWAVGDAGTIVHFDGAKWSPVPSGTKADFRSIHGKSANDLWAVASDGAIAHYDGSTWNVTTTLEDAILADVLALGPTDVWAAGQTYSGAPYGRKGVLAHFDGTSWTKVNTGISTEYYYGISTLWGTSSNDLYFVSGSDVYRWNGTRSDRQLLPRRGNVAHSFEKVWGTASNDVWVVGGNRDYGIIWHYDGAAWSIALADNRNMLGPRTVWGTSRTDVWVAGYLASDRYGTLHWDGTAWTAPAAEAAIPSSATPSDGWSIGTGDAWLVGEPGTPWHWNGTKWENDPGFDVGVRGFWGTTPNNVWAIGHLGNDTIYCSEGHVLHGTGEGAWSPQRTDANGFWRIWGAGPNDIWAVASPKPNGPTIYRYDGQNWAPMPNTTGSRVYLHDVWGAASNDVWIAGEYRLSHWNGTEFKNFATNFGGISHDIYHAVWGLSSNDVWTYGGLQCYYDPGGPPCTTNQDIRHWDGTKWNPLSNSTIAVKSFGGSAPNDVFAVGIVPEKPNAPRANKPRIEHWDGRAWSAMRLPEGTKGPLYAVWAAGPSDVYAVGEGGTILFYDGAQWSLLESGTPLPLYSVWGTDANHLFIGGKSGTILRRER